MFCYLSCLFTGLMTCFSFYCRRERKPGEIWNGSSVAGLAPHPFHIFSILHAKRSLPVHPVWWPFWFEHKLYDSTNGLSLASERKQPQT